MQVDITLKKLLILMSLLQSTNEQTDIFSALVCPAATPATFASVPQSTRVKLYLLIEYNNLLVFGLGVIVCKHRRVTYSK